MPAFEKNCCYESNKENIVEKDEKHKVPIEGATLQQHNFPRKRLNSGHLPQSTFKKQALQYEKLMINEMDEVDDDELDNGSEGYLNLEEGHELKNRYQIIKKLGCGSFGLVYLAKDLDECETVALKISRCGKKWNENSSKEVTMLKAVRGSNKCVKFIDDFNVEGEHGTHHVIVFEMLGPTLHDILHNSNQGSLTTDRLKKFLKNLLEGLVFIHDDCGLIHCDMKPDNIMITIPESEVEHSAFSVYLSNPYCLASLRIADFGLAEFKTDSTPNLVQTCEYRAPEMFLLAQRTTSIDMWSMGCIAFEMALQQKLFACWNHEGQNNVGHLSKIASELGPIESDFFEKTEANKTIFSEIFGTSKTFSRQVPSDLKISIDSIMDKSEMSYREAEHFHDFLMNLLCIDPTKRMTAKKALNHPFLQ